VKLVHLVGFIIRIYHDARSPERYTKYVMKLLLLVIKDTVKWGNTFLGLQV